MVKIICPKCKSKLTKYDKTYICQNKHSYDISHFGYTNLLLANKKSTSSPGDNKIMIDARKDFLSKNFFLPLSDSVCNILTKYLPDNADILDVGCGTGYYTNKIKQFLPLCNIYGLDISKDGIITASKQNKNIEYFVASAFDLPFEDNSFDALINIFSPKAENEFLRILKNNGYILEVVPESEHLKELKEIVYGEKIYMNKLSSNFEKFNLEFFTDLKYTENLSNQDILNLVKMTPYFYKTKKTDLEKLNNIDNLEITFNFRINLFKKEFN